MKSFTIAALGALALIACAPAAQSADGAETQTAAQSTRLAQVLAHERRADDRARDAFRHPGETLAFFEVEPDHTVIEYAPGGGWYTRVLAPYLAEEGRYIAVGFAPEAAAALGEPFVERVRKGGESFAATQAKALGLAQDQVPFYFANAIPAEVNGTVDRVLIFRMMHNLKRWGIVDGEIAALHAALKPGGMLGIVQHRAKPDAPQAYVDGNKGYLKQDELIAYIESKGFELVDTSEINANPNDPADHEAGVWTLPPSYAMGDTDRAKYEAIGESDRMTLLFRKPA